MWCTFHYFSTLLSLKHKIILCKNFVAVFNSFSHIFNIWNFYKRLHLLHLFVRSAVLYLILILHSPSSFKFQVLRSNLFKICITTNLKYIVKYFMVIKDLTRMEIRIMDMMFLCIKKKSISDKVPIWNLAFALFIFTLCNMYDANLWVF